MMLTARQQFTSTNRALGYALTLTVALSPSPVYAQLTGMWRIESGAWAPWQVSSTAAIANARLQGGTIAFSRDNVRGPAPFGCASAALEFVLTPAEGMFQGSLPQPAVEAARKLGVNKLPVLTVAVRCDSSLFDYHLISSNRMLVALDNVIWTLTRGAIPMWPEDAVLAFLHEHMTGDQSFTRANAAAKRRWFTSELSAAIDTYFGQRFPTDEPPPINGDPFTNSQEYPDRFVIGRAQTTGNTSTVIVEFRDAGPRVRRVVVLLRRIDDSWRVDDLRYDDGSTFRAALKPAK